MELKLTNTEFCGSRKKTKSSKHSSTDWYAWLSDGSSAFTALAGTGYNLNGETAWNCRETRSSGDSSTEPMTVHRPVATSTAYLKTIYQKKVICTIMIRFTLFVETTAIKNSDISMYYFFCDCLGGNKVFFDKVEQLLSSLSFQQ